MHDTVHTWYVCFHSAKEFSKYILNSFRSWGLCGNQQIFLVQFDWMLICTHALFTIELAHIQITSWYLFLTNTKMSMIRNTISTVYMILQIHTVFPAPHDEDFTPLNTLYFNDFPETKLFSYLNFKSHKISSFPNKTSKLHI